MPDRLDTIGEQLIEWRRTGVPPQALDDVEWMIDELKRLRRFEQGMFEIWRRSVEVLSQNGYQMDHGARERNTLQRTDDASGQAELSELDDNWWQNYPRLDQE